MPPSTAGLGPVRLVAGIRAGFGALMLTRPEPIMKLFALEATPGNTILARGIGARDLASGLQVLTTPATPIGGRRFLQGRALIDLLEIGAFAAAARGGRRHWTGLAVPVSAVVSAMAQLRLARRLGEGAPA
jgi:hypothetical protein